MNNEIIEKIVDKIPMKSINTLDDLVNDIIGICGADWVKRKRENLSKFSRKLDAKRLVTEAEHIDPDPAIAEPLLREAALESDEKMLDLWANLLINASNPVERSKVARSYISILSELSPVDVHIFNKSCQIDLRNENIMIDGNKLRDDLSISSDQWYVAIENLFRLRLLKSAVVKLNGISSGGYSPSAYLDVNGFQVSHLGKAFYQAVSKS